LVRRSGVSHKKFEYFRQMTATRKLNFDTKLEGQNWIQANWKKIVLNSE